MNPSAIQPPPDADVYLNAYIFEYLVTDGRMPADQARRYVDAIPGPTSRPFAVWCYNMRIALAQAQEANAAAHQALADAAHSAALWKRNARWSRIAPVLFILATIIYAIRPLIGDWATVLSCALVTVAVVGLTVIASATKGPRA